MTPAERRRLFRLRLWVHAEPGRAFDAIARHAAAHGRRFR